MDPRDPRYLSNQINQIGDNIVGFLVCAGLTWVIFMICLFTLPAFLGILWVPVCLFVVFPKLCVMWIERN